MSFVVNRTATPYLSHVGNTKTPVFVLDNFLDASSLGELKRIEGYSFSQAPTYYPGIRCKLPEEYVMSCARSLVPLLHKIYSIPANYRVNFFDSYYSLVTSPEDSLSIEQRIPHFDGTENYRFALLHYLNSNQHGGTAFYRHETTQIERVSEMNVDEYLKAVGQQNAQNHFLHRGYINSSTEQFTQLGTIPYAQNRMAIYPGNLLHSGIINANSDISADPSVGRLTANIFLSFTAP